MTVYETSWRLVGTVLGSSWVEVWERREKSRYQFFISDHLGCDGQNFFFGTTIYRGVLVINGKECNMETDTNTNFRKAFETVINGYEGKYGFDKDDPGGDYSSAYH